MKNNWQIKKLKELGSIYSGGTPDTSKSEYWNGNINWLTPSEVSKLKTKFIFSTEKKITDLGLKNSSSKILPKNSLIVCTRATIGDLCINKIDMCTNQGFKNIIVNQYNNIFFLYYLLLLNKKKIIEKASGSTFLEISKFDFENLAFLIPPLAEQEKIVSILSKQDEVIEKLEDLIELKVKQKKGLMQRFIYTQKNTKSYKVKDLFELGRGRVISKNEIEKNKGIYPVYSSQTLDDGILGYINTYDFECKCITWTTDGANAGDVFYRNGRFNCTNVCGIAKAKDESMINLYYATCFLNHVTKKYVSYVGNPKLMNGVFAVIPLELSLLTNYCC